MKSGQYQVGQSDERRIASFRNARVTQEFFKFKVQKISNL